MKRKTITLVVYMLVCISLVSVGFAAWVITGGESQTATGNVYATNVTDESLKITDFEWIKAQNDISGQTADKIAFGKKVYSGTGNDVDPYKDKNPWLNVSGVENEKLYATYQFTIDFSDETNTTGKIGEAISKLDGNKFYLEFTPATGVDAAVTAGYIVYKGMSVKVGETEIATYTQQAYLNALKAVTTNSVVVEVTISYAWGTKFGGVNPYEYYNAKPATDYKEIAKTDLNAFYGLLYPAGGNQNFSLVVAVGDVPATQGTN